MAANPPNVAPNTTKYFCGAAPKFAYVYFEGEVPIGSPVQWSDTAAYLGKGVEDPVNYSTRVAGVCCQTMTAEGWGWIQTGGYCDYILTDGSVTAPNADTVGTTHTYLYALAAGGGGHIPAAAGCVTADVSDNNPVTGGYASIFAMNLAADSASNIGSCILCCRYQ